MMAFSSLIPERKSPIPGIPVIPGGTLWSGHLHLLQETNFQKALHKWTVEHADASGRCTFYMGPTTPSLSLTHCEDVQLLLKASAYRSVFPLMETHFTQLFGTQNVGLLNGKEWKQQRSVLAKALHSKGVIKHHEKAIQETTHRLVDKILASSNDDGWFHCQDLVRLMKALTLDCFGKASFHVDFRTCQEQFFDGDDRNNSNATAIGPAFDKLTQELMRRVTSDIMLPTSHLYSLPTKANRNFALEKKKVLTFLQDIVSSRQKQMKNKEAEIPSDLLSGFLEHFASAGNVKMDEKELALVIAQSILGLLFAGYETSSITMSYTVYLLSQHPDVLNHCLEEIEQVEQRGNGPDMPYLEAVIKETLRLYPPAISTTRSAEHEMELPAVAGGKVNDNDKIVVPKGTYLYFAIWMIQRDPKHFDNPNDFVPERWVTYSNDRSWEPRTGVNQKAWIPFSAGARACPGQRFAMQEMITILSCLLPRLSFETLSDYVLEPCREGFVQTPKGGIPMIVRRRSAKG